MRMLKFLMENKVKTNKGTPLEFSEHNFMLDFLCDDHNRIVMRKPTQVGATVSVCLKILERGSRDPLSIIYTLPTLSEAKSFVLAKFDPLIERSEGLARSVQKIAISKKQLYNTSIKRIGPSYYFFRGSFTTWGAQSIDADILVVDELDFQKEDIRKMFEERIEGSNSKDIIYWIGYPSIPGYGIEELYQSSDQRQWYIECPHCQMRQVLSWPESIDMARKIYVCRKCHKELSNDVRKRGLWKAGKPDAKIHGYAVNKLMAPWVSAERLIKIFERDNPRKFANFTLGLPYVGSDCELTDKMIENALVSETDYAGFIAERKPLKVCGIDQGAEFHILTALLTEDTLLVNGTTKINDENSLKDYLVSNDFDFVVMDSAPNQHTAKKMLEVLGPNRFIMADEQTHSKDRGKDYYEVKLAENRVNMNRTESFDVMYDMIAEGKIKFRAAMPKLRSNDKYDQGVIDMLRNLVPDTQERFGRAMRVYKAVGPDHLAHSLGFMTIGAQILYPEFAANRLMKQSIVEEEIKEVPWYVTDFEQRIAQFSGDNYGYVNVAPINTLGRKPRITPRVT